MRHIKRASLPAAFMVCFGILATAQAASGQLPLGYRVTSGTYPWTGRLHAFGFRTAAFHNQRAVLDLWEAGALLDRRDPGTRRLYLGGASLSALQWPSLDDDAREKLDMDGRGKARLAWLRGAQSDPTMRPRDTRMAGGSGARVRVVAPPAWLPMQPGHTGFRNRHATRPTMVWLGTRDGIVHGFDAVTGHEFAGYLPRALLAKAAAFSAPGTPVPAPPCPWPDSVDADINGQWRTLLLCGIPSPAKSGGKDDGKRDDNPRNEDKHAALFVLDVSEPDAISPIGLIWEVAASDALPLTGSGPLRAAMWIEHGVRRWAAVAVLAPADSGTPAGLALLPLDRPASAWAPSGNVRRMWLPDTGCGAGTASARLLAATVHSDGSGEARAAYASDNTGRLWRFALGASQSDPSTPRATCLYRQRSATGAGDEPPIVVVTASGPLVVYGSGGELSAIPDQQSASGAPRQIDALLAGEGVVLRGPARRASADESGWTLGLPHPDEQVAELQMASPVHLAFTTRTPDGRTRSYLIDAATGESVIVAAQDGSPSHAITGLPFDHGQGMPVVTLSRVSQGPDTSPGVGRLDVYEVSVWRLDGDSSHLLQQARMTRRRGRLGWREPIRTPL